MTVIRKYLTQNENPLYQRGRVALAALLVALGLTCIALPAQAAIRYVDVNNGMNNGTCTSSATPCATIAFALNAAVNGDDIKVAEGIYTEAEIVVTKAVTITGGFDPDGPAQWNSTTYTTTPTILDGENVRRPLRITGNKAIIQYMTIRNGNATNAVSAHMGGGILVAQADDVTLRGLTLIHNTASTTDNTLSTGGGIALAGDASLLIEQSLILSNTTIFAGGGIGLRAGAVEQAVLTLKSSVIAHNDANAGGAIGTAGSGRSHINVYHTTFADNGGPADEAIFMTAGHPVSTNSANFSYSLLTGNNTAFRATTDVTPAMLSTGILMDTGVVNDWEGNVPALNPAVRRSLTFVNAAVGDYHLVPGSPALDIAINVARVDLEGREVGIVSHCTPLTLCPYGRGSDYGAYEFVHTVPLVRYVAVEGNEDLNNCLDPNNPCSTLEQANKFVMGGDEVRVATGVYQGGDSLCGNQAVLCVRQGITVTGGFTLTNWNTPSTDPALTVIDGTGTRQGIQVDYNVPTATSLIRNITVRNGTTLGNGGGIAINTQNIGRAYNLTIRNCRVENNQAGNGGGGIYANEPSNLRVEDCAISGNQVTDGPGGGLAIIDATGTATYTLTNLTVFNNFASRPDENSANGGVGGGIFLQGVGTLRQSEIYSNSAAFSGGGVTTGSNGAHPTIDRVYIHDNLASMGGGFSIFLTGGSNLQNSLLARNAATSTVGLTSGQTATPMMGGNAIHSPYVGLPNEPLNVINVTIADNSGAVSDAITIQGTADPNASRRNFFTNVLISGNDIGIRSDGNGFADLKKVLITNNVTTPTQNFDASRLTGTPLSGNVGFVGGGDYHLVPGADGVDDGDTVAGITHDLDGVSRPVGPAFDIGAYETTLQKQNQTITFAPIANRALADSPFTVQPTASSGLPVTLESLTPTVCTVSPSGDSYSVTLVAVGSCSLRASQPGNAAFNPAPAVTRSFKIGDQVPAQMLMHLPVLSKD